MIDTVMSALSGLAGLAIGVMVGWHWGYTRAEEQSRYRINQLIGQVLSLRAVLAKSQKGGL